MTNIFKLKALESKMYNTYLDLNLFCERLKNADDLNCAKQNCENDLILF